MLQNHLYIWYIPAQIAHHHWCTLGQPQPLRWAHDGSYSWRNVGLSVGPTVYQRHLTARQWSTVWPPLRQRQLTVVGHHWCNVGSMVGLCWVNGKSPLGPRWPNVGSSVGQTLAPVVGTMLGCPLGQRQLAAPGWATIGPTYGRPMSINRRWAAIGTTLGHRWAHVGPNEKWKKGHVIDFLWPDVVWLLARHFHLCPSLNYWGHKWK